jgi:hypothetical protein
METSHEIDVTNLDDEHRRALEDLIGTELRRNQRLMICVTDVDATASGTPPLPAQSIGDWAKVYEGLSNEQVEEIDVEVNKRADLTRSMQ